MDGDITEKIKRAKTAQEIVTVARESGMELSDDRANEIFARLNESGELADDELDAVAGGGCHKKDGRLVVTIGYDCLNYKCKECGRECTGQYMLNFGHACKKYNDECRNCNCGSCAYMSYEGGLWLCNHPSNKS